MDMIIGTVEAFVLAGILGSVVTFGYGSEGKHGANYMQTMAASVAGTRAARLVPEIKATLQEAIAAGGSSLRDYVQPDGELGYFSKQFAVYGREGEPCACGGVVERYAEGGRSTFWCPSCQR